MNIALLWVLRQITAGLELLTALEGFNDFHPIGRLETTQDIAKTIGLLLSDGASGVTGVIWDIDGVLWPVVINLW